MSDTDLDSIEFSEEGGRIMYVNELSGGGLGFVVWNGDLKKLANKNVIRISPEDKEKLIGFLTT